MSIIHNDHHAQLFCIAAPPIVLNAYNWQDEPDMNAWTIGQERLLLNTSLGSKRNVLSCYSTFGGTVNCMQLSPLDPNR